MLFSTWFKRRKHTLYTHVSTQDPLASAVRHKRQSLVRSRRSKMATFTQCSCPRLLWQKSPVAYSPWGRESQTPAEWSTLSTFMPKLWGSNSKSNLKHHGFVSPTFDDSSMFTWISIFLTSMTHSIRAKQSVACQDGPSRNHAPAL